MPLEPWARSYVPRRFWKAAGSNENYLHEKIYERNKNGAPVRRPALGLVPRINYPGTFSPRVLRVFSSRHAFALAIPNRAVPASFMYKSA